jgi:3-phytase
VGTKVQFVTCLIMSCIGCLVGQPAHAQLAPVLVTDTVRYDTDDPAIWINPADPAASLVIGTDKNVDGALYVFDLSGKVVQDKVARGLLRPNNVDIAYGVLVGGERIDVAVVSERLANRLRVYRLPDMARCLPLSAVPMP